MRRSGAGSCSSKRAYATRHEAHEVISDLVRRGQKGLRIYRCPQCEHYHIAQTESVRINRLHRAREVAHF